jgi:superfamily II DNA or RNA helicase
LTSQHTTTDQIPFGEPAARLVAQAREAGQSLDECLDLTRQKKEALRTAVKRLQSSDVDETLARRSVRDLTQLTKGRVRVGVVEAAGYKTILDVENAGFRRLERIDGVGPHTARQLVGAAGQLRQKIESNYRFRLDTDNRPAHHEAVVRALLEVDAAEAAIPPLQRRINSMTKRLKEEAVRAEPATRSGLRLFFTRGTKRQDLRAALDELAATVTSPATQELSKLAADAIATVSEAARIENPWTTYANDAARLNGVLAKIAGAAPADDVVQGGLPKDIADRVSRSTLDTSMLRASLRGYQEFGAKYIITQERSIIGDEMGLGKTVEALAAASHLAAAGATHFLVVAPAGVLVNWLHETRRHSELQPLRIHGPDRALALRRWKRSGGVAVTTYETLRTLDRSAIPEIALLIADEAHRAKNTDAQRTKALLEWLPSAKRVVFLTGTPIENRVDEFKTLISHLNPELASSINTRDAFMDGAWFRERVAPIYLRRNQDDVLTELPERIESEDWIEFTKVDLGHYRDAVMAKQFMSMRRAAYVATSARDSAKLERLLEIVEEALQDDRKIVIFSNFLDTLDSIQRVLTDTYDTDMVAGSITGKVSPDRRQGIVDAFTDRAAPGVLLGQIQACGEGLNIQAASVAIIAEPQWKPSIEEQAIGRLQRMGQVRRVSVHRLLASDSVDERMLETLATKKAIFDEFARKNAVKDASPMAIDVSDVDTAIELSEAAIIDAETARLTTLDNVTTQIDE